MAKIIGYVFAGILVLFGIGLFFHFLSTASSVATAPGRVIQRTMETDNIIATYERFHDRWKGYEARVAQLRETQRYYEAETDPKERSRIRVDPSAQRQSCREIASAYNADSAKTNREIFRGRTAPVELDMAACG